MRRSPLRQLPATTSHPLEWHAHQQSNQPSTRPRRSSEYTCTNTQHMYIHVHTYIQGIGSLHISLPSSLRPYLYFYVGECPVIPAGARPFTCMCSYSWYVSHYLFLCHTFIIVPATDEQKAENSKKSDRGIRPSICTAVKDGQ